MPALKLHVEVEKLRLSAPFRISGFVFEEVGESHAIVHRDDESGQSR
jgi:hypothetical protein